MVLGYVCGVLVGISLLHLRRCLESNHTTEVAVGFGFGLRTRLWATSSRLILRKAVHRLSMLALSLLAQSDRSAQTGCSSWRKAVIRSSSYPRRPARLHQSLSSMWLSPSPPLTSIFSTFSLVCRGRSKQGSSSIVTTAERRKRRSHIYFVSPKCQMFLSHCEANHSSSSWDLEVYFAGFEANMGPYEGTWVRKEGWAMKM